MPAFLDSNSSISARSFPAGSSGSHHCENCKVTVLDCALAGTDAIAMNIMTAINNKLTSRFFIFFLLCPGQIGVEMAQTVRLYVTVMLGNLARENTALCLGLEYISFRLLKLSTCGVRLPWLSWKLPAPYRRNVLHRCPHKPLLSGPAWQGWNQCVLHENG